MLCSRFNTDYKSKSNNQVIDIRLKGYFFVINVIFTAVHFNS